MKHSKPFEFLMRQDELHFAISRAQQDAFLMLKLMVQGEFDVSKNRLTSQSEVFGSMRATLLDKNMTRSIHT